MKNKRFLYQYFSVCLALLISTSGHAQNNVVVIPVAGDDAQNALPVAYGIVKSNGDLVTSGFGATSASRTSTGVYTVTLTQTVDDAVILVTAFDSSPDAEIVTANNSGGGLGASNQIEVNIVNEAAAVVDTGFYFLVFGTVVSPAAGASASQIGAGGQSIDGISN